jgi:uncharacterized protein (TIGR03083 family)
MEKTEIWPVIHAERKALAADLHALSADQWQAASLCDQWTVRDVTAHMTATAKITPPVFFAKMLANGFSFGRLQAKDISTEKGSSPADTLARFEAVVTSVKHPPGPIDSWLGETIIHAEDIRRAVGVERDYPTGAVVRVADFYRGSNLIIGAKRRIAGLTLQATDADWSCGSGPKVSGPVVSLLLAMTGRKAALGDLSGDGVTTLRERP